jgi:hypothetical protein
MGGEIDLIGEFKKKSKKVQNGKFWGIFTGNGNKTSTTSKIFKLR